MPGPIGAQKRAKTSIAGPPGKCWAADSSLEASTWPVNCWGSRGLKFAGLKRSQGFTCAPEQAGVLSRGADLETRTRKVALSRRSAAFGAHLLQRPGQRVDGLLQGGQRCVGYA